MRPAASPLLLLAILSLLQPPAITAQEPERTTIGGYGEVHYTNRTGPDSPGEVNVKRFVVYLAHTFSERISFHSELEVEDTKVEGGAGGGEVALEQAFLAYRVSDGLTVRTGLVLTPIGIINEIHEPPTFNGVARPSFEENLIPTTWREIGVGAVGAVPGLAGASYRAYLVSGLKADGFTGPAGIRGGRQEGREASFANPSLTGRLEWARPGLKLGASFWYGGSANQDPTVGRGTFAAPVSVLSVDARYDLGGFMLRGVAARIGIGEAQRINAAYATAVGSRLEGGYLEAAYDLLHVFLPASGQRLNAFLRHERYDTQAAVPPGTPRDDTLARRVTTFGLSYKPVYNVVFKADYALLRNRGHQAQNEVMSLGAGYQF